MIHLHKISKVQGSRVLFEEVTLAFQNERYGLTGPNGAGKSTLLRIIMGLEEPTTGQVTLPQTVGMLRQDIGTYKDMQVLDAVIMGNARLWQTLTEREALYQQEITDEVGIRLGELEEIIAEEDGYSAEAEAEKLLAGAGVKEKYFHERLGTIPTDMQFRVLLCQALFGKPQALLLDEPTNHLDLTSITWLEEFLRSYAGTLIVVSHDRHFLNAVTTYIADIDYETLIVYPGNYDAMVTAKMAVRAQAEQEARSKDKKIAKLREFVAKFGAGTRASQVQSRIREIDRLQPQDLKKSNIQRPYIRFATPEKRSGKIVFNLEAVAKGYGGHAVISDFSGEIHRGDRVGVIGNNGLGKTTLLKLLAGVLHVDGGKIEGGHQVRIGYFPQNHTDLVDKGTDMTSFDWLKMRHSSAYDVDIRGVLGKMLFSGDDAFKAVSVLSGGETARLILADLMLSDVNTLILDEPNNHLDLEAVSALSWCLTHFTETCVVASHDRSLLDSFATKLIAFEEESVRVFNGSLEEYLTQKVG